MTNFIYSRSSKVGSLTVQEYYGQYLTYLGGSLIRSGYDEETAYEWANNQTDECLEKMFIKKYTVTIEMDVNALSKEDAFKKATTRIKDMYSMESLEATINISE